DLGDEVVLHQPTADEFGLGQDAPYLLRRMVKVVVDEDRPRRGHRLVHHFNSLSRSSMRPSRSRQKSSWRETQSISGASFWGSWRSCAWGPVLRDATSPARASAARCCDTAGCETPATAVSSTTVASPCDSRSNKPRRVGSASALKTSVRSDAGCSCMTIP